MELALSPMRAPPVEAIEVEIVERKGLGHPDTICDALADALSAALCRFYDERFGLVLHHNVDKVLLRGGAARPAFGGGEVTEPIEIYMAGRATHEFKGVAVPVRDIAVETARDWLRRHVPHLDPVRHVTIHCLLRPGSLDLVDLFLRQRETGMWLANDTSIGVGYAPLTTLERAVLAVERRLNAPAVKARHPEAGEDVKVMGVRHGERAQLTVACALVDRHLRSLDDYFQRKAALVDVVDRAAREIAAGPLDFGFNTADDERRGSVYLTVTGTSAEAGDDGETGRGNRANGLITPYRPMTIEAAAGKNPMSHVGKLYQIAAQRIATALVEELDAVHAAECYLVSRIGHPLTDPQIADVKLEIGDQRSMPALRPRVEAILGDQLARLGQVWRGVIAGTVPVY